MSLNISEQNQVGILEEVRKGKARTVPANCSRYFSSTEEALRQPLGEVLLEMDPGSNYVYNSRYNEEITLHDNNYCTSNDFQLKLSINNFLSVFSSEIYQKTIVDIGCGQGEFVNEMNKLGVPSIGFDPVLRNESENLFAEYYNAGKIKSANERIFVMRCVLPHIQRPFDFLSKIMENDMDIVYLEFQRIEWIIENQLWSQISHDHINYFSTKSFSREFKVLDSGTFAHGEWGYVCLKKGNSNEIAVPEMLSDLILLEESIPNLIEEIIAGIKNPFGIYGAAGKGILFAHEISKYGISDFIAFDENTNYWNRYMECSAIVVRNPLLIAEMPKLTTLIVMNPNHFDFAQDNYGKYVNVINMESISRSEI